MDKQPTEAQIKEFWGYFGFVFEEHTSRFEHWWTYYTPEDMMENFATRRQHTGFPPIDLDNLFKYAVPKAVSKLIMTGIGIREAWDKLIRIWMDFYFEGMEIENALFWAIRKAIEGEK